MVSDLRRASTDPGAFGELVLGRPLWAHQLEFARSKARYRVVCAGRQVGKSTGVAVVALHEAATRPGILVLLVSAGEEASKRLLAECVGLASGSELLRGSLTDDSKSSLTLSNGSRILSVPASERQIRGWPVDLLILDEAGFIGQDIWRAAEPAIIARPGSRVVLLSSPWGASDHFFRRLWNRGKDTPDAFVESWHWPSTVSPLVDKGLLEQIRENENDEYFRREYLAEWTDEAGAYLTEAEIESCVADYQLTSPEEIEFWLDRPFKAAAGIDWGMARDANAAVLVSVLEDHGLNRERLGDDLLFFIPWLEARSGWAYSDFIERVVNIGKRYHLRAIISETNGVGAYPTTELERRTREADLDSWVYPVVTDVRRKQSGFGKLKGLLQQRRIVLPRYPELLKQLRCLQYEQLPTGNIRIAVPDNLGHDDIAMALMQAISSVRVEFARRVVPRSWGEELPAFSGDVVETTDAITGKPGVKVPVKPLPVRWHDDSFAWAEGSESKAPW